MQDYIKISILLCIYGVSKEFRPVEPYIVPYMTGPPLNLTADQINHDIFPVSTYVTMASLVAVFLITDFLRYKIIIILESACIVIGNLLLIFGRGVFMLQIEEGFYGLHLAAEVAYFTYIYAKVDKDHFQAVTSYTRSAYLIGKCVAGLLSQILVYYNVTSLLGLLYISTGSSTVALLWALFLPSVDKSMYFHRDLSEGIKLQTNAKENSKTSHNWETVRRLLWTDFMSAFTNEYVVKWSLWWALASAGYFMVTDCNQVLWQIIRAEAQQPTNVQYNGAVETIYTLLGALGSIVVGRVHLDWKRLGEPLMAVCSLVIAVLLYVMSGTYSEYVAYGTFIVFVVIFQTMITVANSEVAKHINRESYGLIFGITTFAVYVARSVFTFIALQLLRLSVRVQFQSYASYFVILGVFFLCVVIFKSLSLKGTRSFKKENS